VTCLKQLVDRLETLDDVGPIVLVDNESQWPPMVDYLSSSAHAVVRVGRNGGHRALWELGIHSRLRENGPFVVTDPDVIPDAACPSDALAHLGSLLDRYPSIVKAGLGLRIDDLPEGSDLARDVLDWESQFWETECEPGAFAADIDTTFALYRPGASFDHSPAIRTGPPYVARHLPWYADPAAPDPEDLFYRVRTRPDSTNWHDRSLQPWLAAALARRRRQLQGRPDHPLLDAWSGEPDLHDESEFTPWARHGWPSWNAYSAERDFCDFVGSIARVLQPKVVIETGVGQGFTTRRIDRGVGSARHLCYESDSELREALASLPYFADRHVSLSSEETPSDEELGLADLTVLDSDPPYRFDELARWRKFGRAGSVLVVHDCGNGHPPTAIHSQIRELVSDLDIPGTFLGNPRGGFLGIHPGAVGPKGRQAEVTASVATLQRVTDELALTRRELERMRSTLSWKVTGPLRAVQAKRLRNRS
jgi:hypothetical protein